MNTHRSSVVSTQSFLSMWVLCAALAVAGCARSEPANTEPITVEETEVEKQPEPPDWALAIHGGAGVIEPDDVDADAYSQSLAAALRAGAELLAGGAAAIEVVEKVVVLLEDDPKFNAGRGAVYTSRGTHELDAAIMDGRTLACGAAAGVKNVRNPIQLARRIMERSPHVLLAGDGADQYSREVSVARVQQSYFNTSRRYEQWQRVRREGRSGTRTSAMPAAGPATDATPLALDLSTVGAVALDRYGNLAAATSTGGMTNKRFGRIGDVPIIGAGTYANNQTAAISGTGKGEEFIRHSVAHDISARMSYRGASLEEAAREVIHEVLKPGDGGVIGVDKTGALVMEFNSAGMFRGAADSRGRFEVGIWEEMEAGIASR